MTIALPLRDGDGRRSPPLIAQALQHGTDLLATEPAFGSTPPDAPATLGSALDYAVAEDTTKRRGAESDQCAEWLRARAEVLCVIAPDLPLAKLNAHHVYAVATSAMARVAYEVNIGEWQQELSAAAAVLSTDLTRRPQDAQRVLGRVVGNLRAAGGGSGAHALSARWLPPRETTNAWATRSVELLRAMLRHAGRRERERYFSVTNYSLPDDVQDELAAVAKALHIEIVEGFRPAYEFADVRALMDHVRDPRYALLAAVASVLNGVSALRVPRSRIRIDSAKAVSVRRNSGSEAEPRLSWVRLGESESAIVLATLRGPLADDERAFLERGIDYRPIMDVRWRNGALVRVAAGEESPRHPRDVGLLDPRAWLLAVFAPEGRGGQVVRCWRSDLLIEQHSDQLLLAVGGSGTKLGPTWMLCEQQRMAWALAIEVGHLRELESLYRNGSISDYPLMPAGRLRGGRALAMGNTALQPVDDRTMNDWVHEIEHVLGIEHVDGRGWHGWRRAFARLFDLWHANTRLKNLITGHEQLLPTTHGNTRQRVYLDQKDLRLLTAAQALCEHVRTEFIRTAEGPGPAPASYAPGVED